MIKNKKTNRDRIELEGEVVDSCKSIFKIKVSTIPDLITCSLSGKIRENSVRILVGDRVKIEVTPFDPLKGRIIYRIK